MTKTLVKAAEKHCNLDEVQGTAATVTLGGEVFSVISLADLPFVKMNELTALYNKVEDDQEALAKKEGWDAVKSQMLILIPNLTSEKYEEVMTIQRVSAFLKWHADLSQTVSAEKNVDGASD